jgi:hypothetical protein
MDWSVFPRYEGSWMFEGGHSSQQSTGIPLVILSLVPGCAAFPICAPSRIGTRPSTRSRAIPNLGSLNHSVTFGA